MPHIHGENLAWIVYLDPKADDDGFAGDEGVSDLLRSTARPNSGYGRESKEGMTCEKCLRQSRLFFNNDSRPDNEAASTAIHVKRSVPLEGLNSRNGNVAPVFLCEPIIRNEPIPLRIILVRQGTSLHVSVAKDI